MIVGVIGGLGPAATVDFFAKVLAATPAKSDQDHIHLLIDSNPALPNRNDAIAGRGPSPGPGLCAMAQRLERAGAAVVVMVCNTAHHWQPDIEAALTIPFLSLIDVTADRAKESGATVVGVLAADGCLNAHLYDTALTTRGITPILPTEAEQATFMSLLYRIKAGDTSQDIKAAMRDLALAQHTRGAEVCIAACTEVPLVLTPADVPFPVISSTDVLVEAVVSYTRRLPACPDSNR